ncbi:hypothetical protein NAPIS_ORF01054 [Vairimorpha apis BRL 01]|uniref:Uncharacterized protein n=1 Tax=Vairimorpha apis BRL 01 TaxID=1037528 RepID=T0L1G0_9MICR|nr:hypothetical protein NAPIS_ORF01054 [Vairimorpha apis BRL 01]
MHENIYESKSYRILAYVKNNIGTQITINKCLEIKSTTLTLKGFTRTDSFYFPKLVLHKSNNILHLLIIERCSININRLLKNIFPTFFKILGEQFDIYKYIPNIFEHVFIEEDDIFENELILSDEDLIF